MEQVHIIGRIFEAAGHQNLEFLTTFLDFCKAFDSLDLDKMFAILRHYSITEKIVLAITALYHSFRSLVSVDGDVSDDFPVETGVLQGDVLAPFLFGVINWVITHAINGNDVFTT